MTVLVCVSALISLFLENSLAFTAVLAVQSKVISLNLFIAGLDLGWLHSKPQEQESKHPLPFSLLPVDLSDLVPQYWDIVLLRKNNCMVLLCSDKPFGDLTKHVFCSGQIILLLQVTGRGRKRNLLERPGIENTHMELQGWSEVLN